MSRDYWVILFTGKTWKEFFDAGADTVGFRKARCAHVQKIEPKDYLLCYLTGLSRFVGVLEVESECYIDEKNRIWKDEVYPCRFKVKPVIALTAETAVPVLSLKSSLSIFENLRTPTGWSVRFRASPQRWSEEDAKVIVDAIRQAKRKPVERPFSEAIFNRGRLGLYSRNYKQKDGRG